MKPLATLSWPARADGTRLPALLALVLVLMAALQFALPTDVVLPDAPGRTVANRLPERIAFRAIPDDVILRRALFAPGSGGAGKGIAATGPLDGATPVGVVRGRGFARAILQQADGSAVSLPVGAAYHSWRLTGIAKDSATFFRDGKKLVLPLSSDPPTSTKFNSTQQADER